MKYEKATTIQMKTHPELSEKWVQERMTEDSTPRW